MLVRNVMNRNVVTAKPDTPIKEAAAIMSKNRIGSLIVTDNDKIVGIVTERNIMDIIAEGIETNQITLADIMKKDVITIDPSKTIEDAVDIMVENKIKKLPVVDGDKLIGIITASDIAVLQPKLIANIAKLISLQIPGYRGG